MEKKLEKALDAVDILYSDLITMADDILSQYTKDADNLIKDIHSRIDLLTMDDIRSVMLKLSTISYSLGDMKEKSAFKADCAEMIKKETYAKNFIGAEGAVAAKENTAIIQTSDEIVVNALYDLLSSLFKTKLDEIHRIVDTLKSILMTRMQEMKLSYSNNITDIGE